MTMIMVVGGSEDRGRGDFGRQKWRRWGVGMSVQVPKQIVSLFFFNAAQSCTALPSPSSTSSLLEEDRLLFKMKAMRFGQGWNNGLRWFGYNCWFCSPLWW